MMEAVGQQTTSSEVPPAKKPRQITNDVEGGSAAECPGLDTTPPFDTPAPHTQGTNPVTIWQGKWWLLAWILSSTYIINTVSYFVLHYRMYRRYLEIREKL